MSFSFNARYALFTYPQCGDLDPFAVSDHFSEMGAECIVAREAHADGGTHLHAFVDFGRKYRTRRVDAFDVAGQHPNVSPSHGTPAKGYDYAIKDGDVVAGGLSDHMEKQFLDLAMRGLQSSRQRVEMSFFNYFMTLLLELCSPRLPLFPSMPIGNIAWIQSHIDTTRALHLISVDFQNCWNGHMTLFASVGEVSKYSLVVLPVATAVRLARARFGGILPGGAPPTPQPARSRALGKELDSGC